MNSILWPVFDFVAKNKWLQWVLLIVTGLIIVRIWMWVHDDSVRKLERAEIAKKQADVKVAVGKRQNEIITEERDHADTALEARDREYPPSDFDQLPVDEKRVLDRRFRSGETPR